MKIETSIKIWGILLLFLFVVGFPVLIINLFTLDKVFEESVNFGLKIGKPRLIFNTISGLILGVMMFFGAIGLLKHKEWGRKLLIYYSSVSIIFSIFGIIFLLISGLKIFAIISLVNLIIPLLLFFFLIKDKVKKEFY